MSAEQNAAVQARGGLGIPLYFVDFLSVPVSKVDSYVKAAKKFLPNFIKETRWHLLGAGYRAEPDENGNALFANLWRIRHKAQLKPGEKTPSMSLSMAMHLFNEDAGYHAITRHVRGENQNYLEPFRHDPLYDHTHGAWAKKLGVKRRTRPIWSIADLLWHIHEAKHKPNDGRHYLVVELAPKLSELVTPRIWQRKLELQTMTVWVNHKDRFRLLHATYALTGQLYRSLELFEVPEDVTAEEFRKLYVNTHKYPALREMCLADPEITVLDRAGYLENLDINHAVLFPDGFR